MSTYSGPVLVSACLAGRACRFDGTSCPDADVLALVRDGRAVLVCPEEAAGLPTPRPACELSGGRVRTADGADLTDRFREGAMAALRVALTSGCRRAILKAHSPSCGVGVVHDGSFGGGLTAGDGVFAAVLAANGISLESR